MNALLRVLFFVVAARNLVALGGYLWVLTRWGAEPHFVAIAVSSALLSSVGIVLVVLSRREQSALALGTLMVLLGASSASLLELSLGPFPTSLRNLLTPLLWCEFGAFMGLATLRFSSSFPRARVEPRVARWAEVLTLCSLAFGVVIFAWHFLENLSELGTVPFRAPQIPGGVGTWIWSAFALFSIPSVALLIDRARRASKDDRNRAQIVLAGLVFSNVVMLIGMAAISVFPELRGRYVEGIGRLFRWFTWTSWIVPPIATAYAVLVDQVFDVRLVLRQALRYSLARTSLAILIATPFVGLVVVLFRERNRSLAEITSSGPAVALAFLAATGLLLLAVRRPLFRSIDRQFFREQYDARQIMSTLVERSRETTAIRDLLALLMRELDRALHLDTVAALALDSNKGLFRSPRGEVRALPEDSLLAAMLLENGKSLTVDLGAPGSHFNRLPHQEQQWLTEGAYHLLVPMISSDDMLIGLLCLGEKRSELPFSPEDRSLLDSVAASAALSLENRWMLSSQGATTSFKPISGPVTTTPRQEGGLECPKCGRVYELGRSLRCEECDRYLEPSILPPRLLDKYEVQRRLGAGGMGVVYQALDESLGRRVAIKTLPKVAPERALRLRREARVMATITHPNLALILAAEAYQGRPLLVFEFLDGGTLADRLEEGPLSVEESLDLAILIAGVLESAHQSGVLHRDVKPGNVAFGGQGTPKLLDFGLAKLIDAGDGSDEVRELNIRRSLPDDVTEASITRTQQVVGTPAYLSPEAVAGRRADPSFDLWSLALTLYECIAGDNPMRTGSLGRTLDRISSGDVPDIRTFRPATPTALADYLETALAADPAERPATARAMLRDLRRLRLEVAA